MITSISAKPLDNTVNYSFANETFFPPTYNASKWDRGKIVMLGYHAFPKPGLQYFRGEPLGTVSASRLSSSTCSSLINFYIIDLSFPFSNGSILGHD
jgi:hypothetical protein